MANSLIASLFGLLDSRSVDGIAKSLEAPENSVLQGLKSSIASVLGGMAAKSGNPDALRSILDLAPSVAEGATLSQVARAASDPNSPLIFGGRRLLSTLFGSAAPSVVDGVGNASGLRAGTVSTVLAMAAPLVTGFISQRVRADRMSMRDLGSLLQRETGEIRAALPPGLANIFWPSPAATANPVVAQSVRRERSSLSWLPLLALAILVAVIAGLIHHARRPAVSSAARINDETASTGTASRAAPDSAGIVRQSLGNTDLRFDTGSAQLRPESSARLDNIAAILKAHPDVHVKCAGYTDNTGDTSQNLQLSEARAKTVVAELTRKGVPVNQLTAEGNGDKDPIDDNSTGVGRAKNRRVSLIIWQP
jgi:outer membrane protein OmpA-like peptidoglycan-associated protein